jgi:WhiB family redox-sensing transcriptional regulator
MMFGAVEHITDNPRARQLGGFDLRRGLCAREACEMPRAEGMWAGVVIPEAGRGRTHALRRLRSLAERGGYPVRQPAWRSS